jgi:protease-4
MRSQLRAVIFSVLVYALLVATGTAQDKTPSTEPTKAGSKKFEPVKASSERSSTASKSASTAKGNEPAAEPKTKVQLLPLSGLYSDHKDSSGVDPTMLLLGSIPIKQKSFFKLCEFLESIEKDESIGWVVLDLSDAQIGMNPAQCEELNRRLLKLKSSGKKLAAWLETGDSTHLSIASACDEIILAELGSLDFTSAALETMFYRDAMDLLGIKASVVRAGDFKGAVEPFMNSEMSDHLREHYREMLTSINDSRVASIAKGRGIPTAKVRELQAKRFLLSKDALAGDLVDSLAPFGSMKDSIEKLIDKKCDWIEPKSKESKEMSFFEFMSVVMAGPKPSSSRIKDPTIVVLHLSGVIQDGKQASHGGIISGPTVKEIEKLTDDERVRGVVVRINSPGGSATASEAIRRALKQLAEKKPTIVSMGEVAASGGYWISCIGTPVYAEPTTITGSIGVFSLKLSFGSLFKRLGLHIETIALDSSATAFSMSKPWSDEDTASLQNTVDDFYAKFLKLVSESRKLPVDKVEPLAGGRVWSGAQAKQHGLVDSLGGVDDCIAVIAKRAKLDKYSVIHRPEPKSGLEILELLGESDDEILFKLMQSEVWKTMQQSGFNLGALSAILKDASSFQSGAPRVWAIAPAELKIK